MGKGKIGPSNGLLLVGRRPASSRPRARSPDVFTRLLDVICRWVLELDRKRSRRRHAGPLIKKSRAGTPRADIDTQITLHK